MEAITFDPINEQTTASFTAQLTGNDGVTPLPLASISTLVLTLYAIKADGTDQIINTRNAQNVLNTNGVTVTVGGFLTWIISIADTTLVEAIPFERHIALFEWSGGFGAGKQEVILVIRNLGQVP
jgi:hypothetical protein